MVKPENNPFHWRFWLTEIRPGWNINPALVLTLAATAAVPFLVVLD